jgi:cell wall-associated NlpC family hydrolase
MPVLALAATVGLPAAADPLTAEHWIARCPEPHRLLADAHAVAALNRRMLAEEPSLNDLSAVPATLAGDDVRARIEGAGRLPEHALVFGDGSPAGDDDRRRWRDSFALDAVPSRVELRFAVVVRRTAVRLIPTRERVHRQPGETDIDRFQETAFFPGTPVAVLHASADDGWRFVLGPTYAGWVEADAVAAGPREDVLGYAARASRVVTDARVTTAVAPEAPAISSLVLDMGTTLPELREWPGDAAVNGQSPAASIVVQLPLRGPDGALRLAPALVPRSAGTHDGPLPATRAAVLRQAFRFLGERYGWGHDLDGRDCSGFVCDVYRSLGIVLPRNTRDQAVCPALDTTAVTADTPPARRLAAVRDLLPGDLVFTRRHVMMVVGHDDRGPWVIHDTHDGRVAGAAANGVVVQPFESVDDGDALDAVTAVARVLPASPSPPEGSP